MGTVLLCSIFSNDAKRQSRQLADLSDRQPSAAKPWNVLLRLLRYRLLAAFHIFRSNKLLKESLSFSMADPGHGIVHTGVIAGYSQIFYQGFSTHNRFREVCICDSAPCEIISGTAQRIVGRAVAYSGFHGVVQDIAKNCKEIGVVIDWLTSVTVLKQMPNPLVFGIIPDGITRTNSLHHQRQGFFPRLEQ